jgi:hypothetical protein
MEAIAVEVGYQEFSFAYKKVEDQEEIKEGEVDIFGMRFKDNDFEARVINGL